MVSSVHTIYVSTNTSGNEKLEECNTCLASLNNPRGWGENDAIVTEASDDASGLIFWVFHAYLERRITLRYMWQCIHVLLVHLHGFCLLY